MPILDELSYSQLMTIFRWEISNGRLPRALYDKLCEIPREWASMNCNAHEFIMLVNMQTTHACMNCADWDYHSREMISMFRKEFDRERQNSSTV